MRLPATVQLPASGSLAPTKPTPRSLAVAHFFRKDSYISFKYIYIFKVDTTYLLLFLNSGRNYFHISNVERACCFKTSLIYKHTRSIQFPSSRILERIVVVLR
ncbi:rCG23344 [Rattus norvegicus]|uniref:RCG23344 n=1 Tax=Rattus norvegicus TaxID=10116 RepID=A6KHC1_RAT|nr:rCG23344 [Rattus norvegicus]